MKAFLIARVSTDDQADALPAQVYRLKDYALKHEFEYELFEIKESAYKGDRQQFNEILSLVFKTTEPIALIFDKVDRYSRDVSSEEVRILNSLCENGKIELHFCSDHLVINQSSSAGEHFMLAMNTATSAYYSRSISDNVKRRNEQLRRDGYYTGKAPLGYLNVTKDGKKWIDVDPFTSLAVKDAFRMYGTGSFTLLDINKHWREKYNLKSPLSTVDKVLKNPFYYGVMRIKDTLYDHRYETLIDKSAFDAADAVRSGYRSKPRNVAGIPFAYRGMITCAKCGCLITFEIKKGKYIYGHCTQMKGRHEAPYLTEAAITSQLTEMFKSFALTDEVCEKILAELTRGNANLESGNEVKKVVLNAEVMRYKQRLDRMYEDRLDGKIDNELYDRKSLEYRNNIENLKTQLSTLELSGIVDIQSVSNLLNVSKNAYKTFQKADIHEKRELLEMVHSNFSLDGTQLRWKLKRPYELMAFSNNNSTWQGYVESNHDPRFWKPIY